MPCPRTPQRVVIDYMMRQQPLFMAAEIEPVLRERWPWITRRTIQMHIGHARKEMRNGRT